jgi:DNA-binding transcriptional ArsR family regulator
VQWPAARCRRVSYGETDEPARPIASDRGTTKRRGLDATDLAVLEMLRGHPDTAARHLARQHRVSPRIVSRRLLNLRAFGLVRVDGDGLWTAVSAA